MALWLYRFIGVADIASVRFSLPAHLLEPTPNLGRLSPWSYAGAHLTKWSLTRWGIWQNTGTTWIDQRPLQGQQDSQSFTRARFLTGESQHWSVRRSAGPDAWDLKVLVHKGLGTSLRDTSVVLRDQYTESYHRNTSRASRASHIILPSANFSEWVWLLYEVFICLLEYWLTYTHKIPGYLGCRCYPPRSTGTF